LLQALVEAAFSGFETQQRPYGSLRGRKRFDTAAVTIRGIESAAKIKNNQFNLGTLTAQPVAIPAIWTA
jgi:hypothetical protein